MTSPAFTVYILTSVNHPSRHYTGITRLSAAERLAYHNAGKVSHTARYAPWRIDTYTVFREEAKARAFDRYLKSGSGREFARRHY